MKKTIKYFGLLLLSPAAVLAAQGSWNIVDGGKIVNGAYQIKCGEGSGWQKCGEEETSCRFDPGGHFFGMNGYAENNKTFAIAGYKYTPDLEASAYTTVPALSKTAFVNGSRVDSIFNYNGKIKFNSVKLSPSKITWTSVDDFSKYRNNATLSGIDIDGFPDSSLLLGLGAKYRTKKTVPYQENPAYKTISELSPEFILPKPEFYFSNKGRKYSVGELRHIQVSFPNGDVWINYLYALCDEAK